MKGLRLMDGRDRKDIRPGLKVDIVLKQDQRTERLSCRVVKDVLTKSSHHLYCIKVRIKTGGSAESRRLLKKSRWVVTPCGH